MASSRDAVLREGARMTLREKLARLEDAHRLANHLAGIQEVEAASPADSKPAR